MAEPTTFTDLEFHFTHGEPVYATVQHGKDLLIDATPCTHCGRPAFTSVKILTEDGSSTLTVHQDKLNADQRTTRVVKPPTLEERLANGENILER